MWLPIFRLQSDCGLLTALSGDNMLSRHHLLGTSVVGFFGTDRRRGVKQLEHDFSNRYSSRY
jgi:hypothetical protein